MDWIKVLNRHVIFEYNDLSDSEFRAWIKIMSLTAFMEAMPTHEQMVKHVHYKTLMSLQCKLNTHSTDLQCVLNKVLIDAQWVGQRKKYWKDKKKEYRERDKNVHMEIQETAHVEKEIEKEKEKDIIITSLAADKSAACPHEEIIALYHKILPELPAVKIWTQKRQGHLRARWKEYPERQNLEWWEKYFTKIKQSQFLTGNVTDFKANLEWVVNQSNMVKILEGKYDGGNNVGIRTNRSDPRDKNLQSREDAEIAAITAQWEAAKKSPGNNSRGDAGNDDAPDFQGV